jgi:valyl-tRNA synthetase
VPLILQNATAEDVFRARRHGAYLERLAGIETLTVLEAGVTPPESATAIVGEMTVLVPMAGLIDVAAELERLGKRLAKTQEDLRKTQAKLSNENFVRNAPPAVVAQERERMADFERTIASLQEQIARLGKLPGGK